MASVRDTGTHELHLTSLHGRIWDQKPRIGRDGTLLRVFNSRRHAGDALRVAFQAVSFSGDAQIAAAVDKRGHLYLFYLGLNRFSLVSRGDGQCCGANGLSFTRRRPEEVLVASGQSVRVFDADTHRNTACLQGHHREVHSVASAGSSGLVMTQSPDVAILWDAKDWTRRRSMSAQESLLHEVAFTPPGDLCGVLFKDSRVALWRTADLSFERELLAPDALVPPGSSQEELGLKHFSLNDRCLVAGGSGGLLVAWSLSAPQRPPLALELAGCVSQLQLGVLGPDGGAAGSPGASTVTFVLLDDGRLMVVRLKGGEVLMSLDLKGQYCTLLAFEVSCDFTQLLLARSDGTLEARDVQKTVAAEQRETQRRVQLGAPQELLQPALRRLEYSARGPGLAYPATEEMGEDMSQPPFLGQDSTTRLRPPSRRSQRNSGQPAQGVARSSRNVVLGDTEPRESKVYSLHEETSQGSALDAGRCPQCGNVYASNSLSCRMCGGQRVAGAEADTDFIATDTIFDDLLDEDTVSGISSILARKLQAQLRVKGGGFPSSKRARIWQKLLQLPCNRTAYEELEARGVPPKFRNLRAQYSAHSRSTLLKLERLLSALAHWSPTWAEAPFLPALAFPFLKVFGDEPVLCFEAVVTVLLNWARNWSEELPGAPLKELLHLDDLLAASDPELHNHLRLIGGRAVHTNVLWPILQTLLTEVLQKAQWLQLWDHLVANWLEPELLHAVVVAFLRHCRASLLDLPPQSSGDLSNWLRMQHNVSMSDLFEDMYALRAHAAAAAPSALNPDDLACGVLGSSSLEFSPAVPRQLPLPRGRHYPQAAADKPADRRGGQRSWETEARPPAPSSQHRDQLIEVSTAVERLAQEEARFRQQQEELLRSDAERRKVAEAEEDRLLEERQRMDEVLMHKRLHQVQSLYEGMEEQLKQQQQSRALEGQQLLDDLRRRHRQRAYELEARLKEEALLNLEAKGSQHISELLRRRRDEESQRALEAEVRYRRKAMDQQDEVQRQQWSIEDEKERAKLDILREQKILQDAKEAEHARRRQVEMELRLEELERQLQLAQIARERVLRKAQTEAKQAQESSEEILRRRHEVAARTERRQQTLALAQERRRQRDAVKERERLVEEETQRWREVMQQNAEQVGEQSMEELSKDFETRRLLVEEDALHRDLEDEELLRRTLQEVKDLRKSALGEAGQKKDDGAEALRSSGIGEPKPFTESARSEQEGGVHSACANVGQEPLQSVCRNRGDTGLDFPGQPCVPTTQGQMSMRADATCLRCGKALLPDYIFCRKCGEKRSTNTQAMAPDETGVKSEAELDELIKQREAELAALWREFDTEAQELTQETEAYSAQSSEPFLTATSGLAGLLAGDAVRPPGGPLGGHWGDTSEESSAAVGRRGIWQGGDSIG